MVQADPPSPIALMDRLPRIRRFRLPAPRRRLLHVVAASWALVVLATAAWGATAVPGGAGASKKPHFRHVIVVVFENHEADDVFGNPDAPTFNSLAARYATMANYTAVAHPSLPNYLALVSGSTQGIDSDCTSCLVDGRSLADTLQAARKTWKTYAEGLPSIGFTGVSSGRYVRKHNPFLYFRRNLTAARVRRVVPLTQFLPDLRGRKLPAFSLVVPDLCHDMHDCGVSTGDTWLRGFIAPLLRPNVLRNSVVFVVFDEGTSDAGGGGRVPALAIGPLVRRHASTNAPLNHYGLLRTIEQGLGLTLLGNSAGARPITGIWR
jgi:phosphatidylinositol-3-phosphatase